MSDSVEPVDKDVFIRALECGDVSAFSTFRKSDLHNHAGRGGKLEYIPRAFLLEVPDRYASISEMDNWLSSCVFPLLPDGKINYLLRVEGTLRAAHADSVGILATDFGIYEPLQYGGLSFFAKLIDAMGAHFAPTTIIIPVAAIYENVDLGYLRDLFSFGWFKAIDIINYRSSLTDTDIKSICSLARDYGLKIRAHVGEFGSAAEVESYVLKYGVDEIQHGIQISSSRRIMNLMANLEVPLHLCPASNVGLGVCESFSSYPLAILCRHGVKISINTDDLLVFGKSVSQQFIDLYKSLCGDISASELFEIYRYGLNLYEEP